MYYKFDRNTLGVGFIKELLHNTFLPRCQLYNGDKYCYVGKYYIKDKHIVKCIARDIKDDIVTCKFFEMEHFAENTYYMNFTDTFKINESYYDIKTHRWLGDYLRFLKNYYKLNLMPLYNCYSKELLKNVKLNNTKEYDVKIDTSNENYNYIAVPVRFNETYTIALTNAHEYEIQCLLYDKRIVNEKDSMELATKSKVTVHGSDFYHPFTYKTSWEMVGGNDIVAKNIQFEQCLKMVIKLPKDVNTSIVVLEGDYRDGTQHYISKLDIENNNSYITKNTNNYNLTFTGNGITRFGTKLSLLHYNDGESYPFADKLISYLSGYTIDVLETIDRNIQKVQQIIYPQMPLQAGGIWTDDIRYKIAYSLYSTMILGNSRTDNKKRVIDRFYETSFDNLYYIDKDVERLLSAINDVNWNWGDV